MSKKYPAGFRLGAFSALNNGTIVGCVSDMRFREKGNVCGFAYDNGGTIRHSLALSVPKAGENSAGFCRRNRGSIAKSGFLRPFTEKEKSESEVAANAAKTAVKSSAAPRYIDENLRETGKLTDEELLHKYGLDEIWKFSGSERGLQPDLEANRVLPGGASEAVLPISTADELLSVIAAVNNGDTAAASAHYRLEANIGLGGRTIDPLGLNEQLPFTGVFDGNGKTVSNFRIKTEGREFSGFFGYVRGGEVVNLAVDLLLTGKGGNVVGGMVGYNDGGRFANCQVRCVMTAGLSTGGFAGKNTGTIQTSSAVGRIAAPIPVLWFTLPAAILVIALLVTGGTIAYLRLSGTIYDPADVIDTNATPVTDDGRPVEPPPPGSNRISFEVLQEITVDYGTKTGRMDYVNPKRSTQNVTVALAVSDAELVKAGYDLVACGVRTEEELAAEDYDAETALTVLYQSNLLPVGYTLRMLKIDPLPDKRTHLAPGEYEMVIVINAYDPDTNEKAVVNAQAPVTVKIVD